MYAILSEKTLALVALSIPKVELIYSPKVFGIEYRCVGTYYAVDMEEAQTEAVYVADKQSSRFLAEIAVDSRCHFARYARLVNVRHSMSANGMPHTVLA